MVKTVYLLLIAMFISMAMAQEIHAKETKSQMKLTGENNVLVIAVNHSHRASGKDVINNRAPSLEMAYGKAKASKQ